MADIQGFIDEIISVLRIQLVQAKVVPDDPTDNVPDWPFLPVFLAEGKAHVGPPGGVTYHDTVTVGFLTPSQDMSVKTQIILPQKEVLVEAIFSQLTDPAKGFTHTLGFSDISYTFGPVEWMGADMYGFLFIIQDVKIQRTYT